MAFVFLQTPAAQQDTSYKSIAAVVFLDSFVVTAERQGFQVEDFIRMVVEDETFYQAFRNLRVSSFDFENRIDLFNKHGENVAGYESLTRQESDGDCRSMEVLSEQVEGNFYKGKGDYRYYTAKMYDRVFFTNGRVCESERVREEHPAGMDKHIAELKKLLFQPGQAVKVPFIGGRTAIFENTMINYYDYSILSRPYQGKDCYVFTLRVKPEFQERKEDRTIINYMETYFDKETFQVVARDYQLAYRGALFSFAVTMNVQISRIGGQFIPTLVSYNGRWDVPMKKPEIARFTMKIRNFDTN